MVEYDVVTVNYPSGPIKAALDKYPDNCPYCHQGIHPKHIVSVPIGREMYLLQGVYQCPRSACGLIFIANYLAEDTRDGKVFFLKYIDPERPKEPIKRDTIDMISPKFYKIYTEAQYADEIGSKRNMRCRL